MAPIKPPPLFIKAWREHLGLRNIDLAQKLGVSASQLAQWESGNRLPTRHTQAVIASALGIGYLSLYHLPVKEKQNVKNSNRNSPANKIRNRL